MLRLHPGIVVVLPALVAALAGLPGIAQGQGKVAPPPTGTAPHPGEPASLQEAKRRFAQAKAFQEREEFDRAIAEYRAAYALAPLPELIFNLAQCQRAKGDERAALEEYRRYLAAAPAGRGAAQARQFVATLEAKLGAEEAAAAEAKRQADEAAQRAQADAEARARREAEEARARRDEEERARRAAAPAADQARAADTEAQPGAKSQRGARLRLGGIVAAGVGAALMAGGLVYGLQASSASDDVNNLKMGDTWKQDLYESGKSDERKMFVLLGIGGAVLAGGGVAYLLGRSAESDTPKVTVAPTLHGAMFGVTKTW